MRCAHPRVGDRHSESGRLTVHGAFALLVVGVLLVMIVGGAQALGVFQTWRVHLQTQADLAKAERAAQEANRLAALEALERARGDRELHEAAAASIRKDSLVVAWYAVRGDVLALALGVPFMVVLGATLGTMIGRRLAKIGERHSCRQTSDRLSEASGVAKRGGGPDEANAGKGA